MFAHVPEKVLRLARAVREAGGRALLVGGCVRDALMGRASKDWDVEVYGVAPEAFEQRAKARGLDAVNLYVPVLRLSAQKLIAHAAADEQGTPALVSDRAGERENLFRNVRHRA